MAEFHRVCKVGDVPEGEGKPVAVCGKVLALFCINGEHHAIDDMCPHMGASLAGGYVENGIVTCPWHAWQFNVKTGECHTLKGAKQKTFKTKIEKDHIFVDIE